MSKVIKIIGCILAAIGLGCIVKHVVMMYNGDIDECCCFKHLKSKHESSFKKWMSAVRSSESQQDECCGDFGEGFESEPIAKKSSLDDVIERYARGDITKEKFDEIKRNLV